MHLSLVQKIVSKFIWQRLNISKLRNFQTRKVSQLNKDIVCWSETIFSFWYSNSNLRQIHFSSNKVKHYLHYSRVLTAMFQVGVNGLLVLLLVEGLILGISVYWKYSYHLIYLSSNCTLSCAYFVFVCEFAVAVLYVSYCLVLVLLFLPFLNFQAQIGNIFFLVIGIFSFL